MAGPPSARYRIRKFVARNRGPVVAAAIVLVALIAGLAASSVLYFRAERERQRADTQMRVAKRVSEFLTGLFEVSDPSEAQGREVTARELLDKGAATINGLKDQPVAQATLMDTMGHVYYTLGLYDQAASLLENAVKIRRQQLWAEQPGCRRRPATTSPSSVSSAATRRKPNGSPVKRCGSASSSCPRTIPISPAP